MEKKNTAMIKKIWLLFLVINPLTLFLYGSSNNTSIIIDNFHNFEATNLVNSNLFFSVTITTLATITSIFIGSMLAININKSNFLKIELISKIVIIFPHIAFAYITYLIFNSEGLINRIFNTSLSMTNDYLGFGIFINYVLKEIPFVLLILVNNMTINDKRCIKAAKSLGASTIESLTKVYIPQNKYLFISIFIILFAFILGNYEVPALLGHSSNQFTSVEIIENFQSIDDEDILKSNFQVSLLFFISLLLTLFLVNKKKRQKNENI